jgi:pimeloyl-ACP methyl ester carboxylesterase
MYQFFRSAFFNFEIVRLLGTAPYGGADVAECLEAIGEITNDDPVSWHRAWHKQAERAELLAEEASKSGDVESARRAYMRASNYFRASGYMFHDRISADSRSLPITIRSITNFQRGMKLLPGKTFILEIPYEGYFLPGYLYLPPATKRLPGEIPILVNSGGADSSQEELFFIYGVSGPDLGYAVLTFEGPGQGIVLRKQKLHMRPDWEVVVTSVLDYLSTFSNEHSELELDLDRISIAGASMGGYYALRGASDPRIKVCVAIDPFYDMWKFATKHISPTFINAWSKGWLSDGFVNGTINLLSKIAYQLKWEVSIAGWMFGLDTATQTLLEMKKYTLSLPDGGSFLDRVKCPVFVSAAAHSIYFDADVDTMKVYNSLKHLGENQKEVWRPSNPGEGGLQAKVGAFGLSLQKTFQFIDEQLGIVRPELLPETGSK